MGYNNPDFATLAEEAYKAADRYIDHVKDGNCHPKCCASKELFQDYHTKKDKALKAIRGRKK